MKDVIFCTICRPRKAATKHLYVPCLRRSGCTWAEAELIHKELKCVITEIVFMVHPGPERASTGMIERYTGAITTSGGTIHRLEDWGRRQMAYRSTNCTKATTF